MKNGYGKIVLVFFGLHLQQAYTAEPDFSGYASKQSGVFHTIKKTCHACFKKVQAVATKIHDHCCTIPSGDVGVVTEHENDNSQIPLAPQGENNNECTQESLLEAME